MMDLVKSLQSVDEALLKSAWEKVSQEEIRASLKGTETGLNHFVRLLSHAASGLLEEMAECAQAITLKHFGYAKVLYTPLYLSNYCDNLCVYCGFHKNRTIARHQLTGLEIEKELKVLSATGLREILLLTGESPSQTPVSYIANAAKAASRYFKAIAIEVFPMDTDDYRKLYAAGVNGLTVYQETYDEKVYHQVHLHGPKRDFTYRLKAPERGAEAGFSQISIGALLGLGDPMIDAIKLAMHLEWLEKKYPGVEWGVSLPRMRAVEGVSYGQAVSDCLFVQILLAFRIAFPRVGINLSTRETAVMRDHLIHIGVTKLSAGVKTAVGGHTDDHGTKGQFEIDDGRSVEAIKNMLNEKGYQSVFTDWVRG